MSPAAAPVVVHRDLFYDTGCHSHTYELSMTSFAAMWIAANFAILACAFGVFLKHCCYKTFTGDTSKGY